MIFLSIGSATEVYSDASGCEIIRYWVDHSALAEVSRSLRSLVLSIGGDSEGEFWRLTLRLLRRITFALCSTPIPFVTVAEILRQDWEKVCRQARLCEQLYPDTYTQFESLLHTLEPILAETSSPFFPVLELIARETTGLSVIMRNLCWNRVAADSFAANAALRKVKVVSAAQLRWAHHSNALAVIGPCAWFPEYVFSAPRASSIHIISYRWIQDSWKPRPIFLPAISGSSSHAGNHRIGSLPKVGGANIPEHPQPGDIKPKDLLPPAPVFTRGSSSGTGNGTSHREDMLPAKLCQLIGGRTVYISDEDGASSLIIDTSESDDSITRRVPTKELEPGMYLLLRTSGGGDFITQLADQILDSLSIVRRSQQAEWKEKILERAREQFGALSRRELSYKIDRYLRTSKMSNSRAANIHYWMGSKSIRPHNRKDFSEILRFAGLQEREEELWEAMGDIDRAHRQAGHHIRQMLMQKISPASLETLERDGEMDFDLGDQHGGTLSAYQITAISGEKFEIEADQIGRLMDQED